MGLGGGGSSGSRARDPSSGGALAIDGGSGPLPHRSVSLARLGISAGLVQSRTYVWVAILGEIREGQFRNFAYRPENKLTEYPNILH